MEHSFIDEHDVIVRYVAGRLGEDDLRAFEAHAVDCAVCLDRIEVERALRTGLMNLRSNGRAAAAAPPSGRSLLLPLRTMAAAAALLVAVVTSIGYVQVRGQLNATRERLAAQERLTAAARADAARFASAPAAPVVSAPPARITVVELEGTRSAARSTPRANVTVPVAMSLVVFSLAVGNASDYSRFAAALDTSSGATLVRQDDLRASSPSSVAVALDASTLLPGDYTIVLDGAIRNRQPLTIARFPIRVSRR